MAPPPQQRCTAPECTFETPANMPTWDLVMNSLNQHTTVAHPTPARVPGQPQAVRPKPAPVQRPEVDLGTTESEWNFFKAEFERYKRTTGIAGQTVIDELWHCQTKQLRVLLQSDSLINSLDTEQKLLDKLKSLAVTTLHSAVHLIALRDLEQGPTENIRAFIARARATASNCGLSKACSSCQTEVSFVEETLFGVVLAGLHDGNIQQKILSLAAMKTITTLEQLVTYVAAEESGRSERGQLGTSNTLAAFRPKSAFKSRKASQADPEPIRRQPAPSKCPNCGGNVHGSGSYADRLKMCPAQGKTCNKCKKMNHISQVCKYRGQSASLQISNEVSEDNGTHGSLAARGDNISEPADRSDSIWEPEHSPDNLSFFSVQQASYSQLYMPAVTSVQQLAALSSLMRSNGEHLSTIPLPHAIHSAVVGWTKGRPKASPTHQVTLKVHKASYTDLNLALPQSNLRNVPCKPVNDQAVFDSGAQMNITGVRQIEQMGYSRASLFPVSMGVEGANKQKIYIIGGIILQVIATNPDTNQRLSTYQLFYVSTQVSRTYLSRDCCEQLQTLPANFPTIGACPPDMRTVGRDSSNSVMASATGTTPSLGTSELSPCTNTGVPTQADQPCHCPRRTLPPAATPTLPCEPTEENLPILKQFILDWFSSSAFNVCEHQSLPLMTENEPLRLFVDPAAKPIAIRTPSQVPLAWHNSVREGLERDVRLGVLERVPLNTPDTWCSRMHITPKADGSPRRLVDFRPLNIHAPRQTHHTESPWSITAAIPPNTVKSVLDCWHGYHSVPLAPEDRHLTTFLTPWGQYRYLTTPQGFISAGDGYTDRMDRIIGDFQNVKKCVDDSILWSSDIDKNFHQVCSFLQRCSSQGVIFNPKKFQFGEKTVQYIGFQVTDSGIKPTKKYTDDILNFPTPTNITDVRSWYGAIGQINYAFVSAPEMVPFRHLLSSKVPFQWSPDLETAFQKSKLEIVRLCENGIRSFNPALPTALATDWSKFACGLWLTQKHCDCAATPVQPGCCQSGWQTIFCSSKFNNPAESRYAPIEGEAHASAWAMDRCRYFLLGLQGFTLCVDHKPLISILGNKELCDIPNPRLLSQKEKTLMFRFSPIYVPGKKNVVPDCYSRRNDSPIATTPAQLTTPIANYDISNILPAYQDHLGPPSWVSSPSDSTTTSLAALLCESTTTGSMQTDMPSLLATMSAVNYSNKMGFSDADDLLRGQAISSLANLSEDVWQTLHHYAINTSVNSTDVLTWDRLVAAAKDSPTYQTLLSLLTSGPPADRSLWPESVQSYYQYRHALIPIDGVILLHDRPLIPVSLRPEVMDHLHAANAGVTGMYARASTSVWWPNMRDDLIRLRAACSTCTKNAPSNPSAPPQEVTPPAYPFHSIAADFFQVRNSSYLAVICRYSGWLSLFRLQKDDSQHVMSIFREYFSRWGIPVNLTTDGASNFVSHEMKKFLARYGTSHRVSSYYYARANKRAEVAVKSGKRLILDNISPNGSLNTDRVARALLIHHNQTDPVSGLSPSEVIFGRRLRDHLPLQPHKFQPRAEWRLEADQREKAYAKRHILKKEQLTSGSKALPPLLIGDHVAIQDATKLGKPGKWLKTGIVTDCLPYQSYELKVDGSNTLTKRNRVHLRKIIPYVSQTMLEEERSKFCLPPTPPTTRSATTNPDLLTLPSSTQTSPSPPAPAQTQAPAALSSDHSSQHTLQPPEDPLPQPADIKTRQNKPCVRERWILKNDSTNTADKPTSSPLKVPPPPGQKHDYTALAEQARMLRNSIMLAGQQNLTT